MTVTVDGLAFVREQLEGFLPRETTAVLRRTTARIAARLRDEMRASAPVRTGTLRKAIVSQRERGTRDSIEASVSITHGGDARHDAFYWHMVEFGTPSSPARPFLTPAVEAARAGFRSELEHELDHQVVKQLEKRAKAQGLR